MSLVSDALKKAQRARSPDMPAGSHSVGRRGPLLSTQHIIWILVGVAVIAAAGVGTTIVLIKRNNAALAAAKSTQAPPAANASAPSAPAPAAAVPTIPLPIPAAAPRVAESSLPPARGTSSVAAPAAASQLPASSKTPPMAVVGAPIKPELRIQIFIDAAKITGIAIRPNEPTESKVMMNDRVFRINDIVDRTLNLRLTEIFADHLTFVDENSATYTKRF